MKRKGNPILVRLLLSVAVIAVAGMCQTSAQAQASSKQKPGKPPTNRSSTDPIIPAQGKLGQDLFIAVSRGDIAGVRALLKRGADPNSRNGLMFVPLYIAAATGQTEAIEALLKAGAKVDAASPYGTAVSFASASGIPPAYTLLVSRGAAPNPARADGITALMFAARAGAVPIIADILKRKAPANQKDNDGGTALSWAARQGQTEAGKALLAGGASVDVADSHDWTPLMYASVNGHSDFVQALLEKGAKANAKDAKGRTALLLTATYGDHPDVIRALIKGGADKQSAYAVAAARGHNECLSLLGKSDAPEPSAARRTSKEAIQASLKLVQHSMLQFNKRTGCYSCHQEGLGRMATGAALYRGFKLDPEINRLQEERINGALNALSPLHTQALKDPEAMKQVPLIEIDEVATGYSIIMVGMAAHRQPKTEATGAMAMVLARQQGPEGNWHFVLPREPMQSSFFTFTALSIQSLKAYAPASAEVTERINRAKTWLMTAPTKLSEDQAFRLLGLKWAGATEQERQKAIEELRAGQRLDGGWAQLPNLQSDAYATGQALYALYEAGGMPVTDPVYMAGVKFLLRTQDEDGSWFVNKRANPANNYFDAGFPHGASQYSSFNGTCWAVMALLPTVERPSASQ